MTELEALCEKHKIEIEFHCGSYNPPPDSDWKPAHSWTVTLIHEGEQLVTDFFGGSAAGEPTAAGVLYCLVSDTSGVDNARSFEEWASNYGYDTDSRKAEAIFRRCEEQAVEVHSFLGDLFNDFCEAEH